MTPHELLRAFEDKVLGPDVERHEGKVEKGSGSKFAMLEDHHKRRHAALEQLIDADAEVNGAQAALDAAVQRRAEIAVRAGVDEDAPQDKPVRHKK